jgi:hypothetical protein
MEKMEAVVADMELQLKQWSAQLSVLAIKAERATADAKNATLHQLEELKAKHSTAQAKLDQVKAAGKENLHTVVAGAKSAYHELEVAFKKVTS